jgi:hypothetical protein
MPPQTSLVRPDAPNSSALDWGTSAAHGEGDGNRFMAHHGRVDVRGLMLPIFMVAASTPPPLKAVDLRGGNVVTLGELHG